MLRSVTIGVAVVAASVLGFVAATGRLTGPEGVDPSITLLLAAVVVVAFLVALLVGREKPALDAATFTADDDDRAEGESAEGRAPATVGAPADPKVIERAMADARRDAAPSAPAVAAAARTVDDRPEPRIQAPAAPVEPTAPARLEVKAPEAPEAPAAEAPVIRTTPTPATEPAEPRPLRLRPVGDGAGRDRTAPPRINGFGRHDQPGEDERIEPPVEQAAPEASAAAAAPAEPVQTEPVHADTSAPSEPKEPTATFDLDELTDAVTPDHDEAPAVAVPAGDQLSDAALVDDLVGTDADEPSSASPVTSTEPEGDPATAGVTSEPEPVDAPAETEPVQAPDETVTVEAPAEPAPVMGTAPVPMVSNHPDAIERFKASIVAGQRAAIDDLVARGLLTASGPITDRDVETLVFLAVTAQELVAMLENGSYVGADGRPTDELPEARRYAIGS